MIFTSNTTEGINLVAESLSSGEFTGDAPVIINTMLEHIQNGIVILLPWLQLPGMARVSLGIGNSEQDVDTLIQVLGEIAHKKPVKGSPVKQQMKNFARMAEQRVWRMDY